MILIKSLQSLIAPESSQAELMVRACSEIVSQLVTAIQAGKDVNLNGLKGRVAQELRLKHQPRLVDIIAAIPEEHKASLLPLLRAKPIRTASGVFFFFFFFSF